MRSGLLHIAGFSTGTVPLAVNYAGFHPVFVMGNRNGGFGYEMEIITYPGSGINTIEDIRGNTLILTASTSNSGYKAPLSILKNKFKIRCNQDFKINFSGKHSNSIMGVAKKHYAVAAIAGSVKNRMIKRGVVKEEDIVTLYKSQRFPTTGYGYVYNLKPSLSQKITKAFKIFHWIKNNGDPSSLKKEFFRHDKFIPITYKKAWEPIRAMTNINQFPHKF